MFSRIMRRPAGFVSLAFRKTLGRAETLRVESPDYWSQRFSNAALSLEASATRPSASASPVAEWSGSQSLFAAHLLARQQGRAASFLAPRKSPAARP